MKKLALIVIFIAALFGLGMWAFSYSMEHMADCEEENIAQSTSPDGRYIATAYRRGCGATAGYFTHINLNLTGEPIHKESSGLIHGNEVATWEDDVKVKLLWRNSGSLEITTNLKQLRNLHALREYETIQILVNP